MGGCILQVCMFFTAYHISNIKGELSVICEEKKSGITYYDSWVKADKEKNMNTRRYISKIE